VPLALLDRVEVVPSRRQGNYIGFCEVRGSPPAQRWIREGTGHLLRGNCLIFLDLFRFFASERLARKIMKLYSKARQRQYRTLIWPSPDPRLGCRDSRWTRQGAIGNPAFVARCLHPRRQRRIISSPHKFNDLEAQRCPVPFQVVMNNQEFIVARPRIPGKPKGDRKWK
jgi:hypothetical protein